MASVRKREWTHKGESKTAWVVNYTDQGGKRRLKTFDRKKEADKYRDEVAADIGAGVHVPDRESVTLKVAADAFVKEAERRAKIGDQMTRTTASNYEQRLRVTIVPALGNVKLLDLSRARLQAFVNGLADRHAPVTVRTTVGILKMVLQFAVRSGWLKRNIMRDDPVRLPAPRESRVQIASKAEISQILAAAGQRASGEKLGPFFNRLVFVTVGFICGLRKGELCGLQWEDVDFARNTITVRHSYSKLDGLKAPKTRAGNRVIHMAPIVRAALQNAARWRLIKDRLPDVLGNSRLTALKRLFQETEEVPTDTLEGYVLCRTDGGPLMPGTAHTELWYVTLKKAGLFNKGGRNLTIHGMRHAAASLWLEQGARPDVLKRLIGHANISTTHDIYGHLFPEDQTSREVVTVAAEQFDATRARHVALNYGFS